jgi:hypothetical protein
MQICSSIILTTLEGLGEIVNARRKIKKAYDIIDQQKPFILRSTPGVKQRGGQSTSSKFLQTFLQKSWDRFVVVQWTGIIYI